MTFRSDDKSHISYTQYGLRLLLQHPQIRSQRRVQQVGLEGQNALSKLEYLTRIDPDQCDQAFPPYTSVIVTEGIVYLE